MIFAFVTLLVSQLSYAQEQPSHRNGFHDSMSVRVQAAASTLLAGEKLADDQKRFLRGGKADFLRFVDRKMAAYDKALRNNVSSVNQALRTLAAPNSNLNADQRKTLAATAERYLVTIWQQQQVRLELAKQANAVLNFNEGKKAKNYRSGKYELSKVALSALNLDRNGVRILGRIDKEAKRTSIGHTRKEINRQLGRLHLISNKSPRRGMNLPSFGKLFGGR